MCSAFFLVHLLSAFIGIHGVLTSSPTCNENDWNQCSENLVTFMEKPGFPINLTDGEITEICKGILPQTLKCEEEVAQRCLDAGREAVFKNASAEAHMILNETCALDEPANFAKCTNDEWHQCEKAVNQLTNIDPHFVTSPEEDASICIGLNKAFECEEKFAAACFSEDLKVKFRRAMNKMQNELLEKCKPGQETYCGKKKQECESYALFFKTHFLFSAVTKYELLRFCNLEREFTACITKYAEKCEDPEVAEQENYIHKHNRLMKTVCDPSDPFQQRFLNYTACFPKFAPEFDKCYSAYVQQINMVRKSQTSQTLQTQQICCYLDHFNNCVRTAAQSKCGKDVADTGEKLSEISLGKEIKSVCSAYKTGSPECSFLHSSLSPSVSGAAVSESPTGQTEECTLSAKCMDDLKQLKEHGIPTARTENELTRACKFSEDATSCVTRSAEKCQNPSQRQQAGQFLTEMRKAMDVVCKPGDPFRQRYLNYTACYVNFSNQLKACTDYFNSNVDIIFKPHTSEDIKQGKFCCVYESLLRCARTAMERKCGKAVADTGLFIIEKEIGNNMTSFCAQIRHNNPECPSSSRSVSSTTSLVVTEAITTVTAASKMSNFRNTPLPLAAAAGGSFPNFYCFVLLFIPALYN